MRIRFVTLLVVPILVAATFALPERGGDVTLTASGELIASEKVPLRTELPEDVRSVIAKRFPGGEIGKAEFVTVHAYRVVVTVEGKRRSIGVLASGQSSPR